MESNHERHDLDGATAAAATSLRPTAPMARRQALKLFGGAGLVTLAGCGTGSLTSGGSTSTSGSASTSTSTTGDGATTDGSCTPIPEETAGPYPGDGSNGPNVLTEEGVVRSDIRSSFGSATGVADGVPLTLDLVVLDSANGCAPLPGAAVYAWHCDREGRYSLYSDGVTGENYLRGVQEADADGRVTFTSIFPAAYDGRWPHVHFEVYPSLADATGGGQMTVTSQLAFPEDVCEVVYATDGYSQSVTNMARTSLESDMVFSDSYSEQLATVTGSVDAGYVAALSITV